MKILFFSLLAAVLTMGTTAQEPEAGSIMAKSRELTLTGAMKATVNLSITEKNGTSRSRSIQMATRTYSGGLEKRFIKFIDPPDVKGTAMLIIDNADSPDDMWIYLPALKKTRRIVSSEKGKSFMSSEFSNADMSSPALADFSYRFLEGSGKNNEWIIESKPVSEDKADEYGYSKKISHIRTDSFQVTRMEFYNFDNQLFKVIEIKAIHPLQEGRFIVKHMTADNLLTGRKSEIMMTNIAVGSNIDDSVFTLQNLER